ncbi:MAG: hypothetical protein ACMUIU_14425 [bacterium]
MNNNNLKLTVIIGVLIALFVTAVPILNAQGYPPGFDISIEWEHFEEQSKDGQEMDSTQLGAKINYSMPQTFDVFVALSRDDVDVSLRLDQTDNRLQDLDIDPALAFRIGGKLYALRAIPMGVPADFVLSFSYSTANHDFEYTDTNSQIKKDDFTHSRIIGTAGLEWRYVRSTPYLNIGVLYSKLDTASIKDYDQTSLLIAAGIYVPFVENIFFRAEVNVCQEIGYAVGVQYRF